MKDFNNYSELVSIPDYREEIIECLYACDCLDESEIAKYELKKRILIRRSKRAVIQYGKYIEDTLVFEREMRSFCYNGMCIKPKRGLSDHYSFGGQW